MFQIKKKKSINKAESPFTASSDAVKASEVPVAKKGNAAEFSAIANLKALKKPSVPSSEKVEPKSFKGADKLEGKLEVSSNSAYLERIKKRANK